MEKFDITLSLTQDQINLLGELFFNLADTDEEMDEGVVHNLYNLLVNAASAAGADLP